MNKKIRTQMPIINNKMISKWKEILKVICTLNNNKQKVKIKIKKHNKNKLINKWEK
jgi:hypothetical protein